MQALAIALLLSLLSAQNDDIEITRKALEQSTTTAQRLELREKLAGLLSRQAIDAKDGKAHDEARRIYEELLVEMQGADRVRAMSAYGGLLLGRGDVEEAARVFSRLDEREVADASTPLPEHGRYFFNAAEVSMRRGDGRAAFHQYIMALRADPTFSDACDRAKQLVHDQPSVMNPEDVESVIAMRHVECGDALLLEAMKRAPWQPGGAGFDSAIRLTARLWAISPPLIARLIDWKEVLRVDSDCEACKKKADQLTDLVEAQPYRMIEDDEDLQKVASEWRAAPEDRLAFSALALATGHQFAMENHPREALARYVASWRTDSANLEAATFAAGVLVSVDEKIDDTKRIITDLANALAATSMEATTAAERRERINLHITIGDLYAKRKSWSGGRESAIHWWETVLAELKRLPDSERANVPVPELYVRLGDAYERTGNGSRARDYRLDAAGEYVRSDNWPEAERALVRALDIDENISSETMARIERLRIAILFGDLGGSGAEFPSMVAYPSMPPPRTVLRELAWVIKQQPVMLSSSPPEVDERRSSALTDVRISDEVQQRIESFKRGNTSIVAYAVQGVVYLFGPLQRDELPEIVKLVKKVRGVKNVIARLANT